MACHELTALRLGLMGLLGIEDEAERRHEELELGAALTQPGPICQLAAARDFKALRERFGDSLALLEAKLAQAAPDEPQLHYWRALLLTTRKVEQELSTQLEGMNRLWRDLDEIHLLMHQVYPAD